MLCLKGEDSEWRLSFTSSSGVAYQNLVRWLSLGVINLAILRLSLPKTCSHRDWVTAVGFLHGVCSFTFFMLALPGRLLFTVVDVQGCKEWNESTAILRWMSTSPGVWLDGASSISFFIECVVAVCASDISQTGHFFLMASRALCGWHVYWPILRLGLRQTSLTQKFANLLIMLLMEVHLMACAWVYLASIEDHAGVRDWTHLIGHSLSCAELYTSSFYFIGYTITATGY
jgi:hypothetical protein